MSRHPTAKAGTKMLGRYRIERELGRGGMGVVYLATDENTGRLVALKTTSVAQLGSGEKSRNQRRERFVREVRALTQVNHENVVHVFDAGECDDADLGWLLFYTMEYVEGTTLASLVQERGALKGGEAAAVVMQVAAGLGEAHAQGIIHRDVKPANIFLSVDGRAKIGDFGIAKIEGSTQITRRDQLVGTPNYLAPEQILGDDVGPATDVFALGALFFVITQNRPLRQQVDAAALLASANGNDPVQRMLGVQNLAEPLRRAVARALERDPKKRYPNGGAFAEALAEHATRPPALQAPAERASSFLSEGTADRSSAFSQSRPMPAAPGPNIDGLGDSLPDADPADIDSFPDHPAGDAVSIEAIAAAMLGEVERRATGTFNKPTLKADEPAALPVAKTESTVMFNLRALEEEHSARTPAAPAAPAPPAPLPVARTEPTAMFKLEDLEPKPKTTLHTTSSQTASTNAPAPRPPPTMPAESPTTAPTAPSVASTLTPVERFHAGGWDDRTREAPVFDLDAEQPPPPLRGPSASTPTMSTTSSMPAPPAASAALFADSTQESSAPIARLAAQRPVLLAATFMAGILLGVFIAAALAPSTSTTTTTTTTATPAAAPPRPALCAARPVTDIDQSNAAAALDNAKAAARDGAPASKVIGHARDAVAADPTNVEALEFLGRVVTGTERQDADACVCIVGPDSRECKQLPKAK
jgi:serine/threonine protein kinase